MSIAPGSVIGIIGGGQLGRMMATKAAELGYKVHVFTPEADSPAAQVAWQSTVAAYDDTNALEVFATGVDVITFEFENVPHESLTLLESLKPVRPSAQVLKATRNRAREKEFINAQGIATAPWKPVRSLAELKAALAALGTPAILKTAELGYDGKGQVKVKAASEAESAWDSIGTQDAVLEGVVDFAMEISVIIARGVSGEVQTYVPVHNIHTNHILDVTQAPAPLGSGQMQEAERIAARLAESLDLVGLLAVEMFVQKDGRLVVNELAPRPHNSGHWTMDACITGQFEQAIRAVCGLKLGSPERFCDAEMKNLIGDDVKEWAKYLDFPAAKLHLYGKAEARPGRKMGHVNLLKPRS